MDLSARSRRRISVRLAELLTQLCGGLIAAIVLVMLADMLARNLLGLSLPSTAELAVLMMIYTVFVGAAVAVQRGMHFLIFQPRDRYPARILPLLEAVVRGVLIGFSGVMVAFGTSMAVAEMGQLSAAMQIPYGLFYLALPVGGVLSIAFAVLEPLDRSGQPQHEVLM
ncbi:TRAP transporter small permease [Falsiroseomonas sp. HW251]|uniref:TRAP transporter small permease n=1 Tax=Falsiroseomonas sp. HW251 TaxID=3390998 RepID=UPI003D31A016